MLKQFKMKWPKYPCKIFNNKSIMRIANTPVEEYNPFEYYGDNKTNLYIEFMSIDENSSDQILNFVNNYGFLGINIRNEINRRDRVINTLLNQIKNNNPEILKEFSKFEANDLINGLDGLESIDSIATEIKKFKTIARLLKIINTKNIELTFGDITNELVNGINFLIQNSNESDNISLYVKDTDDTRYLLLYAYNGIAATLSYELKDVHPILETNYSTFSFKSSWLASTLLSAMYAMYYVDITQGKRHEKCKNSTCNNWFEIYGVDNRKEFCCTKCAQAHASREYRKRKKEKERKGDN